MDARTAQQKAISKALARRGAATVRRVRLGRYEVESGTRAGHYHTVTHDETGSRWACTCEAGSVGRPCWHQALILILKTEAKGARVTGPNREAAPVRAPANVVEFRQRAA
jgi:hypothetical protein